MCENAGKAAGRRVPGRAFLQMFSRFPDTRRAPAIGGGPSRSGGHILLFPSEPRLRCWRPMPISLGVYPGPLRHCRRLATGLAGVLGRRKPFIVLDRLLLLSGAAAIGHPSCRPELLFSTSAAGGPLGLVLCAKNVRGSFTASAGTSQRAYCLGFPSEKLRKT
jgi:hypothetical protein